MKNIFKTITLIGVCLFLTMGCKHEVKNVFVSVDDLVDSSNTIIIMHPTVNNIKTIEYLADNKILPLKPNYRLVGVFQSDEVYDYTLSEEYILKHNIDNIKLLSISPKLNLDLIYHKNRCSIFFEQIFRNSKGIIFFGGPDVPPSCYGEPTSLLTQITDPNRHLMELSFLFHLLGGSQDLQFTPLLEQNPKYAVLGICLGMQSINVATGGSLYQDIPTEIYGQSTVESILQVETNRQHRNYYNNFAMDNNLIWGSFHQVKFIVEPFTFLHNAEINPYVLSSHHQCIKKLGQNIKIAGLSMDGKIIEAITHARFPNVLGVQFHPEPSLLYQKNEVLRFLPNQPSTVSYIDLYGGDVGENFHHEFWKYFGKIIE
ncbi:MAG: gamma-glutamyl-gamma-aminobutyrate hydrolase family protein [Bacteroidales bacterium]